MCACENLTRAGEMTFTGAALRTIRTTMLTAANGMRPFESAFAKTVILVTDGLSTDPTVARTEATALKNLGVRIFVVGILDNSQASPAIQDIIQ
jgi:hypothetical protein